MSESNQAAGFEFTKKPPGDAVTLDGFRDGTGAWARIEYLDDGLGLTKVSVGLCMPVHMSDNVVAMSVKVPFAVTQHFGYVPSKGGRVWASGDAPEYVEVLIPWHNVVNIEAVTEHAAIFLVVRSMPVQITLSDAELIAQIKAYLEQP